MHSARLDGKVLAFFAFSIALLLFSIPAFAVTNEDVLTIMTGAGRTGASATGTVTLPWNFDNVPQLRNQTYEQIIEISKAEHLDENRTFISNIYEQVKALDDTWSKEIPPSNYVIVTFKQNLTSDKDITLYPRVTSGNPRIEVYEVNGTNLIAEFTSLNSNEYNKVYLTNLVGEQDTFDLRVLEGSIEIDHIIDPVSPSLPWWAESGTTTMTGATTSVDLSQSVNTSKAFIILSRRASSTYDDPDKSGIYAEWVNSTRFNLRQYSATAGAIIVWHVIEGNYIYVQNGTQTYTSTQTSFNIPINSVNVSRTVAFMTFGSCDAATVADTNQIFWTGNVTSSTNLYIKRDDSGVCDGTVAYFVVEFNDGSTIQQGEIANVGASATPSYAVVTSINMSNTWFYFSQASDNTAVGLDDTGVIAQHYNTTAFKVSRNVAGGVTRAHWYAISTPDAYVQYNCYQGMTNNNVTITEVVLNRSFALISFNNSGTGTIYGNSMGTAILTNSTNVYLRREGTGNVECAQWQAVQLPVVAAAVSWNETTATAANMYGGQNKTREAKVTSNNAQNTNIAVTEQSGNGTSITTPNATSIGTLAAGETYDVSFYCEPTISQAPGIYETVYKVASTEDTTGDTFTLKCNVLPSNLTYNETSPISTAEATQGTTVYREINIWSNGTNNQTNITDAVAGAGNGSAFITKNATNLGNLINASTVDVKFTCAPPLEQALGVYEYNVSINSTQNRTAVNLTVKCRVTASQDITISMVVSTVSFENMLLGVANGTSDDVPSPFVIVNDGNTNVNITIEATDLFTLSGFGNPVSNYMWNSTANESGSLQNNVVGENLFGYANMPASASPTKCIGELKSVDSADSATINVNITVPNPESPGNKSSTVTFVASAS